MSCGISDTQWTDYLDRALSPREGQRIESHLRVCASCRAELAEWREVDQRLRIECGILQQSIDRRAQAASRERILAAFREKGVHERLWRLRWVLALLCGPNTATRIMDAAQSHANLQQDIKPTEQTWRLFLRRLAFLTTEICGSPAGELIQAVGE